jgi:hypothetical protein
MLSNLFNAGKCMLGFHAGAWAFLANDSCEQLQVCTRCQARSLRTEHAWGDWHYPSEKDCNQRRVCGRCHSLDQQVVHLWGSTAHYKEPNACEMVHRCERCNAEKPAGVIHPWGEWIHTSETSCEQHRICSRCSALSPDTQTNHTWGSWQESTFYGGRVVACKHCGTLALNFSNGTEVAATFEEVTDLLEELAQASSPADTSRILLANRRFSEGEANSVVAAHAKLCEAHMPDGQQKDAWTQGVALISLGKLFSLDVLSQWLSNVSAQGGVSALFSALGAALKEETGSPPRLEPSTSPAQAPPSEPHSDNRLIGHWRYTDILNGGGMSLVTDTNYILKANGRCEEYTVSAGMGSEQRRPRRSGSWTARNNILTLRFGWSETLQFNYSFSKGSLILQSSRGIRGFERVS